MGKSKEYIIISGLNLRDNNRGTAALGYGSVSFLFEKGILKPGMELLNLRPYKNFLRRRNLKKTTEVISSDGIEWTHTTLSVFFFEWWLLYRWGIHLPWTPCSRVIKQTKYVAAINGGDGFSDIYNTETFFSRLHDIRMAMKRNISVILLPQTIGPFKIESNRKLANKILLYAKKIFIRDDKFLPELENMGLEYELTKDLSYYMKPLPCDVKILPESIGVNVSGLAYSNKFRSLSGQFDIYPELIDSLISNFQQQGKTVYLIPHSYNYNKAEYANDDMEACREAYNRLKNKKNVIFINKNLISPQVKYVISQMSFFIGTRMHANFAAIYTGVPLFGLAYSYKFEGAFDSNGLNGKENTVMINNISSGDIPGIINKINKVYSKSCIH